MNNKYIIVIVGIILILAIFSTLLVIITPSQEIKLDKPYSYFLRYNQTKEENKHILNITAISPYTIDLKGLEWWIVDQTGTILFKNKFPHLNGEEGSTFDGNISVAWFDNDNNKKLSLNDTILINSPSEDLSGNTFKTVIRCNESSSISLHRIELI